MGIQLLDVEVIHDTFVSGVGQVEILGPNARITFYVEQEAVGGGEPDKIVVGKIVVAITDIPDCIKAVVMATLKRPSHLPWMEITAADRAGRH